MSLMKYYNLLYLMIWHHSFTFLKKIAAFNTFLNSMIISNVYEIFRKCLNKYELKLKKFKGSNTYKKSYIIYWKQEKWHEESLPSPPPPPPPPRPGLVDLTFNKLGVLRSGTLQ